MIVFLLPASTSWPASAATFGVGAGTICRPTTRVGIAKGPAATEGSMGGIAEGVCKMFVFNMRGVPPATTAFPA
jgi:hypothetical protein